MKKKLTAILSAAALMVSASVALAAEELSGKVLEVDTPSRMLTLEDGTQYRVTDNVTIEWLRPDQEVTVSYEVRAGKRIATEVFLTE